MDDFQYLQDLSYVIKKYYGTQKTFAKKLDISPTTLSSILNGNRVATNHFKAKIYKSLSENLDLTKEETDKFKPSSQSIDITSEAKEITKNIEQQIINSIDHLSYKDGNEIIEIYSDVFDDLNNIKFSVGGLNKSNIVENIKKSTDRYQVNLMEYISKHSYSQINILEFSKVDLHLFGNKLSSIEISTKNILKTNVYFSGIVYSNLNTQLSKIFRTHPMYFFEDIKDAKSTERQEFLKTLNEHLLLCRISNFFTDQYYIPVLYKGESDNIFETMSSEDLYYSNHGEFLQLSTALSDLEYEIVGFLYSPDLIF